MTSLFKWIVLAALLGAANAAVVANADALAKRLHNAADTSSLDDPALKPWHLKMSFSLLDKSGATTEQGTIEEWWSAASDKKIYTPPSYSATEITRGKEIYRTDGQPSAPYLLELLRNELVHPLLTTPT